MNIFETAMEGLGLTPRPQQVKLVEAARELLADGNYRFLQAGTGTGKSYGVLSVALEAARENQLPSVVVCPNNTLIDQYVGKDAPKIAESTGGKFEYIKGRSRYLCTQSHALRKLAPSKQVEEFNRLTKDGKLEWAEHGLDATYGCSSDCDVRDGDLCAVQIARARAAKAEVIVTNAHVLVWDIKVQDLTQGQAALLPPYGALFVDECHELEGVGRDCLSDQIGPNSAVYGEIPGLFEWVAKVTKKMTDRDEVLLHDDSGFIANARVDAQDRAEQLEANIDALYLEAAEAKTPVDGPLVKEYRRELKALARFIDFTNTEDARFISTITMEWNKDKQLAPQLNRKCVDASGIFRRILTQQPSLLVSGTVPLTLPQRLGVKNAGLDDVGHPFDYSRCTLAISNLSGKNSDAQYDRAQQVINATNNMVGRSHEQGGGGTLILFTSWKDLEDVMPLVVKGLTHDVPIYCQSKTDPQETKEMIDLFKQHGNAVLCGVRSLFTGLDIPGHALRQVIIWKMPWAVPTMEVKAIETIHGRQVYVDDMLTVLTQAIGRLVRTKDDDGRVFIVDSRAKMQRWRNNPMTRHIAEFTPHSNRR